VNGELPGSPTLDAIHPAISHRKVFLNVRHAQLDLAEFFARFFSRFPQMAQMLKGNVTLLPARSSWLFPPRREHEQGPNAFVPDKRV
jgi:hypothetical protein